MAKPNSDRNLLVGILALQLSLINEQQLLTGVKAWAFDKSKFLEDLFLEQQAIGEESRSMLRALVERSDTTQGSDAATQQATEDMPGKHESLPTVMAAIQRLSAIDDKEVQDSVADFLNDRGKTQPFKKPERGSRFRIVNCVAEGGLGRVSLAEDLELHREVALKEILPKYLGSEETRARFLIEAEVTGRLEHPGIVPVYSLGTSQEGGPFYAMQFIRGTSLAEAIRKLHSEKTKLDAHVKRLEIRKLIGRLVIACQAVHYAHTKGVLHRDIKPQNIMLGKFGETFVVDWGLARVNKADSSTYEVPTDESMLIPSGSGSAATRLGAMIGTIEYMSPEQADGRLEEMGPSADVFSLGATLYCVLTGSPPVSNVIKKERSRLDYGHFLRPSQLNRDLPRALDAICLKALETNSSDRYQTAAELVEELEAWMADEPVAAYREPIADRVRRWLRQHQTWAASAAGALATFLVALTVLLVVLSNHNRDLAIARDEAVSNETVARTLLSRELRIDQELLGRNELTAAEIAAFRMRLAEGTFQQYETWLKRNPSDRNLRAEFAFMARALSNLNRSVSKFRQAQTYIQASLDAQGLIPVEQKTDEEKYDFALTALDASDLELLDGRLGNALLLSSNGQKVLRAMPTLAPEKDRNATTLAKLQTLRSKILLENGNYDEALQQAQQADATLRAVTVNGDNRMEMAALSMEAKLSQILILNESGRTNQAMPVADESISSLRPLVESSKRELRYTLARLLNCAAHMRIEQDIELDTASTLIAEASQLLDEQLKKEKTALTFLCISTTERLRSVLLRKQGKLQEALPAATTARNEARTVATRLPLVEHLVVHADAEIELYELGRALGNSDEAHRSAVAARELLHKAMQQSPEALRIRSRLKTLENVMGK